MLTKKYDCMGYHRGRIDPVHQMYHPLAYSSAVHDFTFRPMPSTAKANPENMNCTPKANAVMAGMTMRRLCEYDKLPKPTSLQRNKAATRYPAPSNISSRPMLTPHSTGCILSSLATRGSGRRSPIITAKVLVYTAKKR